MDIFKKGESYLAEKDYFALMGETPCYEQNTSSYEEEIADYKEAINECQAMIDYYIATGNKEEVAYWNKMKQATKKEYIAFKKAHKEEKAA